MPDRNLTGILNCLKINAPGIVELSLNRPATGDEISKPENFFSG